MLNNSIVILLHKKEDLANLEWYRPISLFNHFDKLYTRFITNRLWAKLANVSKSKPHQSKTCLLRNGNIAPWAKWHRIASSTEATLLYTFPFLTPFFPRHVTTVLSWHSSTSLLSGEYQQKYTCNHYSRTNERITTLLFDYWKCEIPIHILLITISLLYLYLTDIILMRYCIYI